MARKFNFYVKRVKIFTPETPINTPDYYSIIRINKTDFTFTGWLDELSNMGCVLEEITQERTDKNKFLRQEYANFLTKHPKPRTQ